MHRIGKQLSALITVAALAAFVPASGVSAQENLASRFTAGAFGGISLPTGDLKNEANVGWHAGAMVKADVYGALDLRLDGAYSKFGKKDVDLGTAKVTTKTGIVLGTLNAVLNLGTDSAAYPGDNTVSPYIIGGYGVYRFSFDDVCSGSCTGFNLVGDHTYRGFNIGGGATVPISGIRTFVEARYHRVSISSNEGGNRTMLLASFGVKFR
ncbi:MAG: hypothetical protein Q7S20_08570 [Gemmatimonadaceae bacterium]|nr:hypothetical protein [Gemmatimonadaceae bacterium]